MMRSKGIILGLCFFHFFLLMSIALVTVDAEDQPVSETNHQKNNSSPVITENINNTLPLNVSTTTTTTVVPTLPPLPNDTSSISTINKDQNVPDIAQGGKLGKVAAVTQGLKTNKEELKRGGWISDWFSCKFGSSGCPSEGDGDEDGGDGAQGSKDPKTDVDSRNDFKKPTVSKHSIGPLNLSM